MTDDERITPEGLGATLMKAIGVLAQAAEAEARSNTTHARNQAEAAERLANALATVHGTQPKSRTASFG